MNKDKAAQQTEPKYTGLLRAMSLPPLSPSGSTDVSPHSSSPADKRTNASPQTSGQNSCVSSSSIFYDDGRSLATFDYGNTYNQQFEYYDYNFPDEKPLQKISSGKRLAELREQSEHPYYGDYDDSPSDNLFLESGALQLESGPARDDSWKHFINLPMGKFFCAPCGRDLASSDDEFVKHLQSHAKPGETYGDECPRAGCYQRFRHDSNFKRHLIAHGEKTRLEELQAAQIH
ncbi:hypothetical protein M422DRAFT_66533 [Sphaerobolus stellatus SS14]|nr:hypothetical protein M422DRAFT_66533 [Sphaerobolus stellatus SS14]